MRKLAFVAVALFAVAAWAGIALSQATIKTFTNCASGGSSAQTLTGGDYLLTVADEGAWICITDSASTCASGGTWLPSGTLMTITVGNFLNSRSVSCRSSGSTGDVEFTKI